MNLIISCEHAGNQVPPEYQKLFFDKEQILNSHRGWDPGAWIIAKFVSSQLNVPLFGCHSTRLLIEANRSLNSQQLFSEFTKNLSEDEKSILIKEYYLPYRNEVENKIASLTKPVVHISMHSFTPVMNDEVRTTDIGILFYPSRKFESSVSNKLQISLKKLLPCFNIDFNKPYKGTDDGFTTYLRTKFSDHEYAGIELEVNQKYQCEIKLIGHSISVALNTFSG
jgi:predicted N-formylglutamate amidohydrolase